MKFTVKLHKCSSFEKCLISIWQGYSISTHLFNATRPSLKTVTSGAINSSLFLEELILFSFSNLSSISQKYVHGCFTFGIFMTGRSDRTTYPIINFISVVHMSSACTWICRIPPKSAAVQFKYSSFHRFKGNAQNCRRSQATHMQSGEG